MVGGCVIVPGDTYLGCEMSGSEEYTMSGASVDDLVVWERYLYDWEMYRMKGITCKT